MHTTQERSCNSAFVLPRNCTFSGTDWKALAPFWYPIAFSHEVTDRPFAAKLLDERRVLFRLSDSSIVAARDLCLHRGTPLSLGWVENDELQCKYHSVGYDKSGQCTGIPAQPDAAIPAGLKLTTYAVTERYGLVWVRLVDNGSVHFPYFRNGTIQIQTIFRFCQPAWLTKLPQVVKSKAFWM
ncbi:Rieske 2Fe-2S domain-containing protein [Microcoleus sp. C2C3]|uniref:Rieske 2Fe-2S domain-containing protein n=1 Tax=unclassified Microcoleus TaxID=2642155 RepID=UPI002FCF70DB